MPRRVIGLLLVVVALGTATGCGRGAQLAEEIAAATGASADDIMRAAEREAAVGSRSADDVLGGWQAAVTRGAGQTVTAYREIPSDIRSLVCNTVTGVLVARFDGKRETEPSVLNSAIAAVGGLNQTAGAQALGRDLQAAKADLAAGNPATLTLLAVQSGVCGVASS